MKCNYFNLKKEEDCEWNEPGSGDCRAHTGCLWAGSVVPGCSTCPWQCQDSPLQLRCLAVRPWACLGILQSNPHPAGPWTGSGGCPFKMQMNLLSCLQWLSPTLHSCLVPVEFEFTALWPSLHLPCVLSVKLHVILETLPWKRAQKVSISSEPAASKPLLFLWSHVATQELWKVPFDAAAGGSPSWEPQPWLLREMLHTPKGDKDSLLSVKAFQSTPF